MSVHPGPTNVFIPSLGTMVQAREALLNEFSRNPNAFAHNQYVQIRPVQAVAGHYVRIDTDDAVRVVNTSDFVWPEKSDAPKGISRKHAFHEYECVRYAPTFALGQLTTDQAPWNIVASNARMVATQQMTLRSVLALEELTTAGNWNGNTGTTSTLNTGSWDDSSVANAYIQKSFNAVTREVTLATGGVITPGHMTCIINPVRAHKMAETPEIKEYIYNHESTLRALQGRDAMFLDQWGLPPYLHGVRILVEHAVRQDNRDGATGDASFILGDNEAIFTAREGDLLGIENSPDAPTFSTISMFAKEDFTVEMNQSREEAQWHRRMQGRVVDNIDHELTSPLSGFYISDVTAS